MKLLSRVIACKILTLWVLPIAMYVTSCSSRSGCTDINATNYESQARFDDSGCTYLTFQRRPDSVVQLKSKFDENSGLLYFQGRIWTFNDGGNKAENYTLDTLEGDDKETMELSNTFNVDWEDIAQDNKYIYIGDFGNNSGNRTDLVIYRWEKRDTGLLKNTNKTGSDAIKFSYPDQTDFRKNEFSSFDEEAMIVLNGNIYIFSKRHSDNRTAMYKIPAIPGDYKAQLMGYFNIHGLVSGADISEDGKILALSAYNTSSGEVFIYLFRDYPGINFFNGKKYKVILGTRENVGQIEGICFRNNNLLYLSNEAYRQISPMLYRLNIADIK